MKEIIYNYDFLNEVDINEYVKRAKLVVENSKNEILIVNTDDNYFLLGGHVDGNESDNDCLVREIKEEAGINYNPNVDKPFCVIKYYCKDYPKIGVNRCYVSNYYFIKNDLIPDSQKVSLTEEEASNHLKLVYISKDRILKEVQSYLEITKKPNVLKDTIDVIEEYLSIDR